MSTRTSFFVGEQRIAGFLFVEYVRCLPRISRLDGHMLEDLQRSKVSDYRQSANIQG